MGKRRKMTSSYHSGGILLYILFVPLAFMVGIGIVPALVLASTPDERGFPYLFVVLSVACFAWALSYFLKWKNVRITVSDEGVTYTTHFGKTLRYTWGKDPISIIDQSPRKNRIIFKLGDRTIRLGDEATNFAQMRGWLRNNGYLVNEAGEPVVSGLDSDRFEILEVTRLSNSGEPGRDAMLH